MNTAHEGMDDMTNDQFSRAGDGKTLTLPYSMDLDPAGIRALVSDAITGALALGAQNESPAPEGHWLGHFWQLGRQHDDWRATVWAVARALNCLPSTFSDANGHVLLAAERLMAERAAAEADTKRLDWLADRLLGADWAYGEPSTSVWLIQTDAAISADLRASIDVAMGASPSPATAEGGAS